ncbi:MAG: ATP-binding cassette domain-containing protein [Streptosporangiaceae bacterium]|nr:ATP-binding cassette domain-containing protein [Streptosporangiaceae bacterium]MBV9855123.1 ATP-binding cassette domain-containing protein [Streptosporangiaceae bacterium]
MIEVYDLSKRYGPAVAVDGLTFEVRPGTVTGFLGPNGSGKSTTMRIILGLDAPDSGEALVCDQRRTSAWPGRCTWPARCWTPRPCTGGGPRSGTWKRSRAATASSGRGSPRCSARSAWTAWPAGGWGASRSPLPAARRLRRPPSAPATCSPPNGSSSSPCAPRT